MEVKLTNVGIVENVFEGGRRHETILQGVHVDIQLGNGQVREGVGSELKLLVEIRRIIVTGVDLNIEREFKKDERGDVLD